MEEMDIAPVLAGAILRQQMGGKYDICFQETRISGIHFDMSIKQGRKESPCLFNLMMRSVFRALQDKWNMLRMGVKMRNCEVRQEEDRVSHMIFADHCCLFAESKEHVLKMIGTTSNMLSTKKTNIKHHWIKMNLQRKTITVNGQTVAMIDASGLLRYNKYEDVVQNLMERWLTKTRRVEKKS